jgi:hypothetical protein
MGCCCCYNSLNTGRMPAELPVWVSCVAAANARYQGVPGRGMVLLVGAFAARCCSAWISCSFCPPVPFLPLLLQVAFNFVPSRQSFIEKVAGTDDPNAQKDMQAFIDAFSPVLAEAHKLLVGGCMLGTCTRAECGHMHCRSCMAGARAAWKGAASCWRVTLVSWRCGV